MAVAASRSARLNTSTKAEGGWAPETAYFRLTMKQGTPLMPRAPGVDVGGYDLLAAVVALQVLVGQLFVEAGSASAVDQHLGIANVESVSK